MCVCQHFIGFFFIVQIALVKPSIHLPEYMGAQPFLSRCVVNLYSLDNISRKKESLAISLNRSFEKCTRFLTLTC